MSENLGLPDPTPSGKILKQYQFAQRSRSISAGVLTALMLLINCLGKPIFYNGDVIFYENS